jgi:hypothetical protein
MLDMVSKKIKAAEIGPHFSVFMPDQTFRGLTYADLIADWMNWIYSEDPDDRIDYYFTYLRGNNIGDPYDLESSALASSTLEGVSDIKNVLDRTGYRGITITSNTALFFSVFDTNFVLNDQYGGMVLGTPYDLRVATRKEYNQVSVMWAFYQVWNGKGWNDAQPIVNSLDDYYAESYPFRLFASEGNRLNREPKYYLQGPREYLGVSVGTYLLMSNFKPGKYRLDFGGISKVEYFTRAIYDITVTEALEPELKDISSDFAKKPLVPKSIR